MDKQPAKLSWKVNNVIRHKETGKPYLVTHVSKYFCTLIDLEDAGKLIPTLTLLPRNFDEYTIEVNMELKKNSWQFNPVYI